MLSIFILVLISTSHGDEHDSFHGVGGKDTEVHLFQWKWTDIANECEQYLGPNGFAAVRTSPAAEHITGTEIIDGVRQQPWWIDYQPVSYNVISRRGNESQFQDMVERCNAAGVRVIVDGVFNHMVGDGQISGVNGVGSEGGSTFHGVDLSESFPAVPYVAADFNDPICNRDIDNNDYCCNADNVRRCRLSGLLDLNHQRDNVRTNIANYLNKLIGFGLAGVRLDAAKHMYPSDIAVFICNLTNPLRSDVFGSNAYLYAVGEVQGSDSVKPSEYVGCGRVTNFQSGEDISAAVRREKDFKYFSNWGQAWYGFPTNDVINFIEDHDTQRTGDVLNYKDGQQYILGVAYLLSTDYGIPRLLSGYAFDNNDAGPPSDSSYTPLTPTIDANGQCVYSGNYGWVCEHRFPQITQMVQWRATVTGTPIGNIVTDTNRIAYTRGNAGFFALNNGDDDWTATFYTGLAGGTYCNAMMKNGVCAGDAIPVDSSGNAHLQVPSQHFIALHVGAMGVPRTKTVIFVQKDTQVGQDMFIMGGLTSDLGYSCQSTTSTDPCALPISHITSVPSDFDTYLTWEENDFYLDFNGAEPMQGVYNGEQALGTPLAYSRSTPGTPDYQPYNIYGDNGYWIVILDIDCSRTVQGWFEVTAMERDGVPQNESTIAQEVCTGAQGGQTPPFASKYHLAKCGVVNVFTFNSNSCIQNSV